MGAQPAGWGGLFERALKCALLLGRRALQKPKLTLESSGPHACGRATCRSGLRA